MIIGMILDSSFPPDPRVENEAISLIKSGHEVYLFCLDYSHNEKEYEIIKGIKVCRQILPKYLYRFSALAYTIPYYHIYLKRKLYRFITSNSIQVLHVHDMQIVRSVFFVNKRFKLPIVLDLHENRPEIMKYYAHVNSILGKLLIYPSVWKRFEYKYIKEAQKVIVVTEEAKQYYLNEIPVEENKFYVVPNTIRKEFYTKYKIDKKIKEYYYDNFTILYIGDTGLRRGLITAIKSLKYLIPVISNIKLVIVGKSKTDDILKKLVTELEYEDYVVFTGWKNSNLFQSYLFASDIGICPIHKNIHHDTTYANKIFQYLSFGKPIVVSDCKAQKRIVEKYKCGLVFKDRDIKNFAEKIITLYRNKDLYQKMSNNAKKAIEENLNWGVLSKELIRLYNEI